MRNGREFVGALVALSLTSCGRPEVPTAICAPGTTVQEQSLEILALSERIHRAPHNDMTYWGLARRCDRGSFRRAQAQLDVHPIIPENASITDLNRFLADAEKRKDLREIVQVLYETLPRLEQELPPSEERTNIPA